jgi:hypothetical protein
VREQDVTMLTAYELRRIKRDLQANLGLIRPDSLVRGPIMAQLNAVDTELAERANAEPVR